MAAEAKAKRRLLTERANDRLANVSEWEPAADLEFGTAGATPRRKAGLSRAPITPPQKSYACRACKRIGMGTRGRFGIWNGWRDTGAQSWGIACTDHAAAKVGEMPGGGMSATK